MTSSPSMPARGLPTGTLTFLFTDLEGSTRLWEDHPGAMSDALARHDALLRDAVETHGGHVVKTTGDGVVAAFERALEAVAAAVAAQRALAAEVWDEQVSLRVRMGVHTGEADLVEDDYHGPTLNRAARLMSIANGGQVVLSAATHGLVETPPDGVEIIDLGEHRLRDLSRREHVYQVAGEGWSSPVGHLHTLDAFPSNLPLEMTSFVGRDEEVAQIAAALADRRLVTVIGVGGVGKTRVALQVAAEVIPTFSHGAWVCELATAGDPEAMLAVVAATLGVKPRAGVALDVAIWESLGEKQMLVLLDNCEHLLSAAGELAEGVLRRCPDVRILATSREALAVAGEQVWPLKSLSVAEVSADATDVGASHAVQLFVDRAVGANPAFAIDAGNAASVADICRRLDGLPLAIELAAARAAAMSPAEIAQLLDERFRLLTGGRRTAVERQQTLRATVDWSYSLLEPVERLVFDRLAVFPGTFDAPSAAAIASGDGVGEWDVRDALVALVAKSLLVADPDQAGMTRYQLLETLRQYARERLDETGDVDVWRRRHAAHFASFAEVAGPALLGSDELPWRRRVGLELDNLRAAVTWSLDRDDPDDAEEALRIIASLASETTMRRASGLASWAEKAAPRLTTTTPGRRAAVLASAGFAWTMRGDLATAAAVAKAALSEEITPDFPSPAMPVVLQCNALATGGQPAAALELALHYAEQFDERRIRLFDRCAVRTVAAIWAIMASDMGVARREIDRAAELAEELGNPSSLAMVSFALGWTRERDQPDQARLMFERSIALARSGASDVVLAISLTHFARLAAASNEPRTAAEAYREGLILSDEGGDLPNVCGDLGRGVTVVALLGELEAAAVLEGAVTEGPMAARVALAPHEIRERAETSERLRAALGEDHFGAAFRRGSGMSYGEVLAYIIERMDALL